jgi:diacylglycerol kinase family enzyme
VEGWPSGVRINFDAGVANGPWGTRYFMEAVGVGLFACTIPVAERSKALDNLDDADAKVAYAIGMLRDRLDNCPSHHLEMTLDGRRLSGEYVLFEAMNMAFVGPNLYLAPDMHPDDGLFDVVLVTTAERDALHESLANWQQGDMEPPELTRSRASSIELEWTGYEVHIDDEPWPPKESEEQPALTHIELVVERNALQFLAPARKPERPA